MAFVQAKFECVNTTGWFSMWHYQSATDTLAVIRGSGYFNAAAGNINTGDVVFIGPDSAGAGGISMLTNTSGVITAGTGSPMMVEAEAKTAKEAGEKAEKEAAGVEAPPVPPAAHPQTAGAHPAAPRAGK